MRKILHYLASVKKNEPIRSAPKPVMVQKHPLVTNAQGKDEKFVCL